MPVTRTYACPECDHQFSFLHLTRDEPPPDYCPGCGSYMGDEPLVMPPLVSIGTHKGKAVDLTYRQLERSGEIRAEITGDPSMKITNLKDNLREGDVAAVAPQPSKEYQQQVQHLAQTMGQSEVTHWQQPMMGDTATVLANAKSGPDRHSTGAGVLAAIQQSTGAAPPVRVGGKWG